ncbi:MAG TPA: TadE family protein [Bryobacteraceae bacterium]|nr:TadE family protein [Bryobacteraceae bacterium]
MKRGRRGNMVLEAALWFPVVLLMLVGMVQLAKITYLYYSLKKAVYTAARYLSVQQGVNFCDLSNDPNVTAALQLAVTGTTDGSGAALISNLTTDMFAVSAECVDPGTGTPGPCGNAGCPTVSQRPDYILVTMPVGYLVQPRIPFITLDPIPLRPFVMVPFEGTS